MLSACQHEATTEEVLSSSSWKQLFNSCYTQEFCLQSWQPKTWHKHFKYLCLFQVRCWAFIFWIRLGKYTLLLFYQCPNHRSTVLLKKWNHCQQNPTDEPPMASELAFVQLPSACSFSNQSAAAETLLRVHRKALSIIHIHSTDLHFSHTLHKNLSSVLQYCYLPLTPAPVSDRQSWSQH